jgi:hypothetical protein
MLPVPRPSERCEGPNLGRMNIDEDRSPLKG